MQIRKPVINDIADIQKLINYYADRDKMLPRSLNELYENIRDLWICEQDGIITGCAAAHVVWNDLAEIKSLAVREGYAGSQIGRKLVAQCIEDIKKIGLKKVFVLSYVPDYFKKLGFREIPRENLPHKIWSECINCPKFPDCGEIALLYDIKE